MTAEVNGMTARAHSPMPARTGAPNSADTRESIAAERLVAP